MAAPWKTVRLVGKEQRDYARYLINSAPLGYVVSIKEPTRSDEQSALMWSLIDDVMKVAPMGRKHTKDEWKAVFMQAAGWEMQFLPGLSGGYFPTGFRSSRMTVRQMADLITWIQAWCAEQGVPVTAPERGA